jgi:2-dehydro-3-deoxygalactonokinase
LFRLRAEGLIGDLAPVAARARLSGLLIGAELAAAKAYWLGTRVGLIGSAALIALYSRALLAQGVRARSLPATDCTLAGLAFAAGLFAKGPK